MPKNSQPAGKNAAGKYAGGDTRRKFWVTGHSKKNDDNQETPEEPRKTPKKAVSLKEVRERVNKLRESMKAHHEYVQQRKKEDETLNGKIWTNSTYWNIFHESRKMFFPE